MKFFFTLIGLNRDIYTAQEMTKNTITNNLEGEVSVETLVEAGRTLDATVGATWRAGSAAYDYKGFAEVGEEKFIDGRPNPYYNEYSHQQSNIHYQEYVGNGLVSGAARVASEFLYQFPMYTAEDIGKRIETGNERVGRYQPYLWNSKGGIKDSFEDIGISSAIIDRRQKYNYNKVEFEQQFNQWKNEQKNNK